AGRRSGRRGGPGLGADRDASARRHGRFRGDRAVRPGAPGRPCRGAPQGGGEARFRGGLGAASPGRPRPGWRRSGDGADWAFERIGSPATGGAATSGPAGRPAPLRGRPMNALDLAVIGIVALSAVFAFARGFVREALSIVAWIGAAAITLYGFNWVYAQVEPRLHDRLLSQLVTGFGLFIISLIVLTIMTGIISRAVRTTGLTPIDRTLGFIFGLARGAFLVCLAYLALDFVPPPDRP